MTTAAAALATAVSALTGILVLSVFVWAARKDGEKDRALQKKLGRRRRTRLGR